MFLLKLIQKLVQTLNSDGTPAQVAAGMALGSALGLTPLLNLHNFIILLIVFVFRVSFPAVLLGSIVFAPIGFLLDPWFDRIGTALLTDASVLIPTWTSLYNMPVVPLSNYNNTVVLGSLVGWLILLVPIYLLSRIGVAQYRKHIYERFKNHKAVKAIKASKVYNLYRLFRPQ